MACDSLIEEDPKNFFGSTAGHGCFWRGIFSTLVSFDQCIYTVSIDSLVVLNYTL